MRINSISVIISFELQAGGFFNDRGREASASILARVDAGTGAEYRWHDTKQCLLSLGASGHRYGCSVHT